MTDSIACPWLDADLARCLMAPAEDSRSGAIAAKVRSAATLETGTLYDLYANELFGLALWLLGSRDEAADAVQDAFVRLLGWKRPLAEVRNPRGFLLRVLRTAALDRIRKRRPTESLQEDSLLASSNEDPNAGARALDLSRALGHLPAKQREALYLRFYLGMTFREIAHVTRVPTFTASSRCRLGLRRLERRMKPS